MYVCASYYTSSVIVLFEKNEPIVDRFTYAC
jgi:hypothetical protein